MVSSTAIAGSETSLSITVTIDGGTKALQESILANELVESTAIEELESTVRTESDGVVAEDIVRDSMMKL